MFKQAKDQPLIVCNTSNPVNSHIFPVDRELIKELFIKELKYLRKFPEQIHNLGNSFFTSDSAEALERRSVFSDFFNQKNLQHMMPEIHKIMRRHVKEYRK